MLQGKAGVIIGASRGIGAAAARAFAANGARTVIASRDMAALTALEAEMRAMGAEALAFPCDVTDVAAVEATVAFAEKSFGRLDIAFNNAAANPIRAQFAEHSLEDYDAVMATNLRSVFVAMRAEIRAMLRSGGGAIVNTTSAAGIVAMPNMAAYNASKHGVVGLTKAAALDHGKDRIRVNAIAPGAVLTDMLRAGSGGSEEALGRIAQALPIGRISTPEEQAASAVWLLSDASSYVTGVTLPVDGGYVVP